jgi:hypothetical protein
MEGEREKIEGQQQKGTEGAERSKGIKRREGISQDR